MEGAWLQEKVSVNKSKSEHLQARGPPLTGRAVCLAWPAGPGRLLGMTKFNAALLWAAKGSRLGSKAVNNTAVAERGSSHVQRQRGTFGDINFELIRPRRQRACAFYYVILRGEKCYCKSKGEQ